MEVALTTDYCDSLGALQGNEIKRAMQVVMAIKNDSTAGGLRAHKIEHPSKHIVSYSVNMDLRIVAYQKNDKAILLYINHHDETYNWLNRRNFVIGPNEDFRIITTVEEEIPLVTDMLTNYKPQKTDKELIDESIISRLYEFDDDDSLFDFISRQPHKLQEPLFELALKVCKKHDCNVSRSFEVKVINDDKVLEEALLYPLEKWRIFLHPKQYDIINTPINQNAFITGAPGTGKTVCLVHKAKKYGDTVKANECVVVTTFMDCLKGYLLSMLKALNYNSKNVFIVDISAINQLGENYQKNYKYDGAFCLNNNKLFYISDNIHYRVRHILIDEYQDYSNTLVRIIKNLSKTTNLTVAFDYSQSIYKQINRTVDDLCDGDDMMKLFYSYRINKKILLRLQKIMKLISMLSRTEMMQGGVTLEEENIINSTLSATNGSDINLISFEDQTDFENLLENEYIEYRKKYEAKEIVVTEFFNDINLHLRESPDFKKEQLPDAVKPSYLYMPSLKGQEYKAGIIILDEGICRALNFNRLLFGDSDGTVKGLKNNARIFYNLLYVALSRFRDYVTVIYPREYQETIRPILGK